MKHLRNLSVALLAACLLPTTLRAQYAGGGIPQGLIAGNLRSEFHPDSKALVTLPPVDSALIYTQEEQYAADRLRGAVPFAIERPLHLNPANSGSIYCDGRGNAVWRLELYSPGAKSLNFAFDDFHLLPGGKLFIYTPDGNRILGAFSQQNNNKNNFLSTAPVPGDRAVIEYSWPVRQPQDAKALPVGTRLNIGALYHDYKNFFRLADQQRAYKPGEPWFTLKSLYCAPPVSAHPEVADPARATLLVITRGSMVFSGALINNTNNDGTPYVLTASHCLNGNFHQPGNKEYIAASAKSTVFFFCFDSPAPGHFYRGPEELTLVGADTVAYNEKYDLCLLRINGLPRNEEGKEQPVPPAYRPYFAGWNISETPPPPYIGIHHPAASVKRYNRTDESIKIGNFNAGSVQWSNAHWLIKKWDVGTTAGGSSGSPLFDGERRIIGALSGGQSYCDAPYNDAYYALCRAFRPADAGSPSAMPAPRLDPKNSGTTTCDGYDPYAPNTPLRISSVIASMHANEARPAGFSDTQIGGIASGYTFPAKVRIIGAHIVMYGDPGFALSIPELNFSVLSGKDRPENILYEAPIAYPTFAYTTTGDLIDNVPRSMGDTIDFFIPIRDENGQDFVDVEGPVNIYAAITGAPSLNAPMPLPVLRLPDGAANAAFHRHTDTNSWIPASQDNPAYRGAYWIDLVVQPFGGGSDLPKNSDRIEIRHNNRTCTILLPTSDLRAEALFNLFSPDGIKVMQRRLESHISTINLSNEVPAGFYLLRVDYKGRKFVRKIYVTHP